MAEGLCRDYLDALNTGNLGAVRALFTREAIVVSPLYGIRAAHDFYAELFADTSRSETTLLNIFASSTNEAAVALHFQYVWTLTTGKTVTFECVDVFELAPDRRQFQKVTIIYDTAFLRADFAASRG